MTRALRRLGLRFGIRHRGIAVTVYVRDVCLAGINTGVQNSNSCYKGKVVQQ